MCGIGGVIAGSPSADLLPTVVALMDNLAHRGPDGDGFWALTPTGSGLVRRDQLCEPAILVLGHRRLSIVDLVGGGQPMPNEDETLWVSYNGEIYNHAELRERLESAGHRFRTRCDTEVLLHGWEEWGESMFGRLNGIFALAIADARSGEVVLARDPLGVKPLYLGACGDRSWWASELGAAVEVELADKRLSADALKLFLTFRFVPAPWSVFEDVWKVPPGHLVRVSPSGAGRVPHFRPFASVVRSSAAPRTRSEWREALGAELERSVHRQLMADVPVASLLSGGVDSSLVTLLMTRGLPYAPRTYGVGFAEEGDRSEAVAAERAARVLNVPHESTVVTSADYLAAWPSSFQQVGEPIANSGGLLVQILCRGVATRQKVVLTGQGADEPLGGYPRHAVERLVRLGRLAPPVASRLVARAWGAENGRRFARALAAPSRIDRYAEIFAVLPNEEVDRYVVGGTASARELAREAVARWTNDGEPDDPVNELLRVDARMSLSDDLLLIADHFSMAESVELRVPFLDLAFVELVERMPSRYKISRTGGRKWLYRQAAAARLPGELRGTTGLTARLGRKRGFSTPLDAWFSSSDGPLANPRSWSSALAGVPALSEELVSDLDAGAGALLAGSRQRALLYALAMWLEGAGLRADASRV